jgi:hypothetical protein
MDDAPEAERTWVGVTAREKMSVMCALSTVCEVRYCLDCRRSVEFPK